MQPGWLRRFPGFGRGWSGSAFFVVCSLSGCTFQGGTLRSCWSGSMSRLPLSALRVGRRWLSGWLIHRTGGGRLHRGLWHAWWRPMVWQCACGAAHVCCWPCCPYLGWGDFGGTRPFVSWPAVVCCFGGLLPRGALFWSALHASSPLWGEGDAVDGTTIIPALLGHEVPTD